MIKGNNTAKGHLKQEVKEHNLGRRKGHLKTSKSFTRQPECTFRDKIKNGRVPDEDNFDA